MFNVKSPPRSKKFDAAVYIDPASRAYITATPTLGIVKRALNK